ncbi:hypothetical protein D3C72_2300380 [compost metagenome]
MAHEPQATGAAGNAESPSLTSIFSNGRPVSSLTVCATIVYMPVPMSWIAQVTAAVPSLRRSTRASAGVRQASQLHTAMP